MEEDDLTVTSSNAYFIISYSLNVLDSLSADRLREDEHLILDLEGAEVT